MEKKTRSEYHYNYYHNNPENKAKILAYMKVYTKNRYQNDPIYRQSRKDQAKQWAIDNRERRAEITRNWQKRNAGYLIEYQKRYKAGNSKIKISGEIVKEDRKIEIINIPRTITF
jgi:hypothetical protein